MSTISNAWILYARVRAFPGLKENSQVQVEVLPLEVVVDTYRHIDKMGQIMAVLANHLVITVLVET